MFLNEIGDVLYIKNSYAISLLSRFVPIFFLSALRNASQEFTQRGQFWGSFLKSIQLPDDKREEIENILTDVNNSVINADSGLAEVARRIAGAGRYVPLSTTDPVNLKRFY